MENRISREKLVQVYHIELEFFDELEEYGLLKILTEGNTKYILYDELPLFERLANWHYDLDVNMPGLEVLQNLIEKMQLLQKENHQLKRNMELHIHHLEAGS